MDARSAALRGLTLPYLPLRWQVYNRAELYAGYDLQNPDSWAATADFLIYRHFVEEGRSTPANPFMGMMQSLHDNAISQALQAVLAKNRVAAIMGGHKMPRDSGPYRDVAVLSRSLTRDGMLVCTGGGPGAMEAGHLGASLAGSPDGDLDAALGRLATVPVVPALTNIVAPDGTVDSALVKQAHAWFAPAFEIADSIATPRASVAIPTWHYGHEPSTPLATHIAKYFQNSIREDGLLAIASHGIVFAEGKAGTTQEIFQDAAQNYYKTFGHFSPMVLLGVNYWTVTLPVVAVLQKLFTPADFQKFVLVTDDVGAASAFLSKFVP